MQIAKIYPSRYRNSKEMCTLQKASGPDCFKGFSTKPS